MATSARRKVAHCASLISNFCTGGGGGPPLTYGGGVMEAGTRSGGDTRPFFTTALAGRERARVLRLRMARMLQMD